MSTAAELLAFLAALFLVDCFRWVARSALIVRRSPLGSSVGPPWRLAVQFRKSLAFGFPLPPFGMLYDCEAWPFDAGDEGFRFAASLAGRSVPTADDVLLPWSDVGQLRVQGLELRRGEKTLHHFGSRAAARATSNVLVAVSQAKTPLAKAKVVAEHFSRQFDAAALNARLAKWRRWQWPVRVCNSLLFFALFGGLGALVLAARPPGFEWVVLAVAASWGGAVVLNGMALRAALPVDLRPTRWQWAVLLVSPLSLIRSFDVVEPEVVGGFFPALVIANVLPGFSAERALQALRRETLFPLRPAGLELAGERWQAQDYALREMVVAQLDRLCADHQLKPQGDAPAGLHCPRCFTEYTRTELTSCSSCAGVSLVTGG